jgi:quercetin dioxygenase-like cupin family protein
MSNPTPYTLHDLRALLADVPPDSILSRTFYEDNQLRMVLFGFAAGQELSEHTAAMPVVIQILAGEGQLTLAGDVHEAGPGTWAHLPARLPHSVRARTPLTLLLWMFKLRSE